ncbi:hypothetical protein LCGC14_0478370 [marine sediment metagenome]|uniref:AAA domain-containing protein n=1 Tax=marine sediment metagenome TaxID=412755 RepID=A0A0F9ST82_9ZZZZ
MPSLSEVPPAGRIKALHVGRSGGGKTVGAASLAQLAPEGEKIYVFDLDGRIRPIVKMYPQLLDKIDFDYYKPHDFERLFDKVNWLLDDPSRYWGVVLDGLTMLADQSITFSMDCTPRSAAMKLGKSGLSMPEIQDYKAEQRCISAVLDNLRTFPRHFIMTAHLITITYKVKKGKGQNAAEEERVERLVVTQGRKIAPKVPIFFDEVYLFEPSTPGVMGDLPEYYIYTVPNEIYPECRSALSLPGKMDWSMKPGELGLYPKIMEEVKKMDSSYAATLLEK